MITTANVLGLLLFIPPLLSRFGILGAAFGELAATALATLAACVTARAALPSFAVPVTAVLRSVFAGGLLGAAALLALLQLGSSPTALLAGPPRRPGNRRTRIPGPGVLLGQCRTCAAWPPSCARRSERRPLPECPGCRTGGLSATDDRGPRQRAGAQALRALRSRVPGPAHAGTSARRHLPRSTDRTMRRSIR